MVCLLNIVLNQAEVYHFPAYQSLKVLFSGLLDTERGKGPFQECKVYRSKLFFGHGLQVKEYS